jgi:hypothetical protein
MPTTVVNVRHDEFDIYCGRGSVLGNPFSHIPGYGDYQVASRDEAIRRHREWFLAQPRLIVEVLKLRGMRLGCFCKPLTCHCDVYAEVADSRRTYCQRCGSTDLMWESWGSYLDRDLVCQGCRHVVDIWDC